MPLPDLAEYFEESEVFSIRLPAENVFGAPELAGVQLRPCVDAGYYVVVKPLRPGQHTIQFSGALGTFDVDLTYYITVDRRRH